MKTLFDLFRKYLLITIFLTISIIAAGIVDMARKGTMPTITFHYLVQSFIGFSEILIVLLPIVALLDLLIVKSAKALFSDFKQADRAGKIIIIVVIVMILLRKVLILTR